MDYCASPLTFLRLGTWNTQGGAVLSRQTAIDFYCNLNELDVVCLQDVRISSPSTESDNYFWITNFDGADRNASRVSGFLIRKRLKCQIQTQVVTPYVQVVFLQVGQSELVLINVYMPCEGTDETLSAYLGLDQTLRGLEGDHPGVLKIYCGDFNAHLGTDVVDTDRKLTGLHIYHGKSNENGGYLWDLMSRHGLCACTTQLDSSTRITRHQKGIDSQLDHVLINSSQSHLVSDMKGTWGKFSDHKLVMFTVRIPAQGRCCLMILSRTIKGFKFHFNRIERGHC